MGSVEGHRTETCFPSPLQNISFLYCRNLKEILRQRFIVLRYSHCQAVKLPEKKSVIRAGGASILTNVKERGEGSMLIRGLV